MTKVIVQSQRVLCSDGELIPAQVHITDGIITDVIKGHDSTLQSTEQFQVVDGGHNVVMSGIVDAHVHVNEPGRTEWEGYETATKAAAAGGITTIVDMPLNCSPVTTSVDSLLVKLPHAERQAYVNIAFWGGITPGMQDEIQPMIGKGVRGFKCFLIHSGIDEFPHCGEEDLHLAYQKLQGTDSVFLFHAEMDCHNGEPSNLDDSHYQKFLESRPEIMEVEAIKLVIKLAEQYRVRSHIVHLSAASALPMIREAQQNGVPITIETCHHYLTLTSEKVPDSATEYKCCPPIRDSKNQDALWDALKDGSISMVVSDHSPCTPDLKLPDRGDFMAAWGGIAGLQLGLSLFWTSCQNRGLTIPDLSRLMSMNTAKHAGLEGRVGQLLPGYRADIVIWNPEEKFKVTKENIHHKNKMTPYMGMELSGVVEKTIVGGRVAFEKGGVFQAPVGSLLL